MVADPQIPTRAEFEAFVGKDFRMIRALERLFQVAAELTPAEIEEILELIAELQLELDEHIADLDNPHETNWGHIETTVPYETAGTGDKSDPAQMPPGLSQPAYPPQYHAHDIEDVTGLEDIVKRVKSNEVMMWLTM